MERSAKDFFNHELTRYNEFIKQRDYVLALKEKVNPLLKGKILDVGSGCIADFKEGLLNLYIAMDLSFGMLSGLDQDQTIKAVCADAISLPFWSNSFDIIIYSRVLHHLNPAGKGLHEMEDIISKALLEAERVLIRDGKIIIVEMCLSPLFERLERWLVSLIRLAMRLMGLPYVFIFSIRRLSSVLIKGGWDDLEFTQIRRSGKKLEWISPVLGLPIFKIPRGLSPSRLYVITGRKRGGI